MPTLYTYVRCIRFFFSSSPFSGLCIDCLHLQLYRDSKDRYKQGQTKASLSLQHFLGVESGFTLDKESNTIAIICQDVIVVLAFDTRERLIQWQVKNFLLFFFCYIRLPFKCSNQLSFCCVGLTLFFIYIHKYMYQRATK